METLSIHQKTSEIFKKAVPLRGTGILQRLNLYTQNEKKMPLQEFLLSTTENEEDKHAFLDGIIAMFNTNDFSKLPPAPGGQAAALTPAPAAPAPAKPKPPVKPIVAVKDEPTTPLPVPPVVAPPVNGEVPDFAAIDAEEDETVAVRRGLLAAIAGLDAAAKKPKPAPGLTADEVRVIVRQEVASILRTIAEVLEKQTGA